MIVTASAISLLVWVLVIVAIVFLIVAIARRI